MPDDPANLGPSQEQEDEDARRVAAAIVAGAGAFYFGIGAAVGMPGMGAGGDSDDSSPYVVVKELSPTPPTVTDDMAVNRSIQNQYTAIQGAYAIAGGKFELMPAAASPLALIVSTLSLLTDCTVETKSPSTPAKIQPAARVRAAPPGIGGWLGYTGRLAAGTARILKFEGSTTPSQKVNVADGTITGLEDIRLEVTGTVPTTVNLYANGVLKATYVDAGGSSEGWAGVYGGTFGASPADNFAELVITPL